MRSVKPSSVIAREGGRSSEWGWTPRIRGA
jgi:hypothetical protein